MPSIYIRIIYSLFILTYISQRGNLKRFSSMVLPSHSTDGAVRLKHGLKYGTPHTNRWSSVLKDGSQHMYSLSNIWSSVCFYRAANCYMTLRTSSIAVQSEEVEHCDALAFWHPKTNSTFRRTATTSQRARSLLTIA